MKVVVFDDVQYREYRFKHNLTLRIAAETWISMLFFDELLSRTEYGEEKIELHSEVCNSESTRAVPMNISLYLALTISMLLYAYPPASLSTSVPVRLQQDVTDPVPDGSSPRKSLHLFSKTNTVRLLTSHPCLRLSTLIAQIL
ncbi:hypothetical protein AVEN_180174-1 [Araneus ventricosus]|uniref:Uncharacterized protein n=1 Tax=Araneus ventricosus TaxID=182803 RepID=A0A4Y2T856_ARAVE|nr:hypothetical protein AVEN_180174-1 [Araneus ventricosus]